MEVFDQERWARLLGAVRQSNGRSESASEHHAISIAIERRRQATGDRLSSRGAIWLGARVLGALAVLAVGAVHLQQYLMLYSTIPTIRTLFVLNFAGATAIGLGLLAPLETLLGRRWGAAAVGILTLAGIGLAATSFAFLAIAESTPLFGFMEPGYDPPAILASRVAEAVAVVSLGAFGIARFAPRVATARW